MLASDILTPARYALHDEDKTRWTDAELLLWLSFELRDLATQVPECYTVTGSVLLTANQYRQSLPAGATRLFDVARNLGPTGLVPGAMIQLIDRKVLDRMDPSWPSTTGTVIEHYLYDFKQPFKYMVTPTPSIALYVEMVYGAVPPAVTALGDTLPVSDLYTSVLLDGVLFRAFSKDAEFGSSATAAAYKSLRDGKLSQIIESTAQRTPADASGASQA